ncbi:unnamed protein product [Triticum turgidum subsp. durum]|uniref:protein-serine/threonine phosphatase n=1 Tax=Triticum turgidum subsp. durum TaxID=4567 RepID=A0A9R0VJH8_TRITD|nr:unnamed protein product [Triticum turgidum subsp. durum]
MGAKFLVLAACRSLLLVLSLWFFVRSLRLVLLSVFLCSFLAIVLSDDHKPDRSDERERIENAGGVVTFSGTWRVGGVLAMSRAFGDRLLKPFVVAEPEIQEQEIDDELEYLILASDGLWDVVSNEHAVAFVKEEVGSEAAARKLTEIAFTRGSTDNITCIVVEFHRAK